MNFLTECAIVKQTLPAGLMNTLRQIRKRRGAGKTAAQQKKAGEVRCGNRAG